MVILILGCDPKPSSNSDLPVAWITGPATDPSLFGILQPGITLDGCTV
jgi:hypothetical protein